jgi:cellulose synthase operon protein C
MLERGVRAAHDRLAGELDRLVARLATIQRTRDAREAPLELTKAYTALIFAAGFARLGQRERARKLVREALAGFGNRSDDPVHAFLISAFSARINQALARRSPYIALRADLIERLHALPNPARFEVDMLHQVLRSLRPEPFASLKALLNSSINPEPRPPRELMALLALVDPAARAAQIEEYLAHAAARATDDRAPLLGVCLDVMLELPEAQAIPLLVQVLPLLEGLSPRLPARALVVAARFGWGELVPAILGALHARLGSASPHELALVLSACLRALRGLGLRDEMAALLTAAEPLLGPDAEQLAPKREHGPYLIRAGSLLLLGDPRGQVLLDRAHERLEQLPPGSLHAQAIVDLAWGYAHGPIDLALEPIAGLAGHFTHVTDVYGPDTHYCPTAVYVVDALVHGITGLADDAPRAAARYG